MKMWWEFVFFLIDHHVQETLYPLYKWLHNPNNDHVHSTVNCLIIFLIKSDEVLTTDKNDLVAANETDHFHNTDINKLIVSFKLQSVKL